MRNLSKIAMAFCIVLIASTAMSDMLTYSDAYSSSTNWTHQLQVPQLSAAVGTLNSVTVQLVPTASVTFNAENWSTTSIGRVKFTEELDWTVDRTDGPPGLLSSSATVQTPGYPTSWITMGVFDGIADYSGTDSYANSWAPTPAPTTLVYTAPADLAYFTGSGTAGLDASAVVPDMGFTIITSGGNVHAMVTTTAGVTATVTYDFTPVPEPCALVLLGIGAISLFAYARRQRRKPM
jgi:hypothetical protein